MSVFRIPIRNNALTKNRRSAGADHEGADAKDVDGDENVEHEQVEEQEDGASNEEDEVEPPTHHINHGAGKHRSLRYQHIEVLVTLVHKCILDQDWPRAERAYSLLLRCKGIDVRLCHDLGLTILNHVDPTGKRSTEFLSRLIVAFPPIKARQGKRSFDRAEVFVKLLTQLRIQHKQFRIAMQELDAWLLVPPYKDDLELWQYLVVVCDALEQEQMSDDPDAMELERLSIKRKKAQARMKGEELMDVEDG